MADKEKTPQNGAQTAKAPADSHRTGITFHDRPMYIDDDDRVYYIDDDGNREYKIKLADVLSDEQRASFEAASKKALSAIADTERIREAINKATGKIFTPEIKEMLREIRDTYKPFFDLLDEIDQLRPYISAELKKPEYNGKSLDDLLDEYTPREMMDLPEDSLLLKAITAAKEARAETRIITPYKANKLAMGTDKINMFGWDLKDTGGQIRFDLSRDGTNDTATALFGLTFDDSNISFTKEINHFDKRVHNAIGTAWNDDSIPFTENGTKLLTLTSIYYSTGGTSSRPASAQLKKIDESLTKQGTARLFLDNKVEAANYNYPRFKYDDALLHFRRISVMVDGKITDGGIEIIAEPALAQFARERKQMTTVPIKALQSHVSKTNKNLQIEDYLLERIARQKHHISKLKEQQAKKYTQNRQKQLGEARKLTITFSNFYERNGYSNKDTTARKRARSTAEKYLQHYQSDAGGHFIESYQVEKDKFIIILPIK